MWPCVAVAVSLEVRYCVTTHSRCHHSVGLLACRGSGDVRREARKASSSVYIFPESDRWAESAESPGGKRGKVRRARFRQFAAVRCSGSWRRRTLVARSRAGVEVGEGEKKMVCAVRKAERRAGRGMPRERWSVRMWEVVKEEGRISRESVEEVLVVRKVVRVV